MFIKGFVPVGSTVATEDDTVGLDSSLPMLSAWSDNLD